MTKINWGAGNYPIKADGWLNLDVKGTYQGWERGLGAKFNKIGDLTKYPYLFDTNSVFCITISHTLNQVPDHESIFKEFYRILVPGGVLRITDDDNENPKSKYYVPHEHTVTKMIPSKIIKQLEKVGFSIVSITDSKNTLFDDRNIIVDNHPTSKEGVDKFFIEAVK